MEGRLQGRDAPYAELGLVGAALVAARIASRTAAASPGRFRFGSFGFPIGHAGFSLAGLASIPQPVEL